MVIGRWIVIIFILYLILIFSLIIRFWYYEYYIIFFSSISYYCINCWYFILIDYSWMVWLFLYCFYLNSIISIILALNIYRPLLLFQILISFYSSWMPSGLTFLIIMNIFIIIYYCIILYEWFMMIIYWFFIILTFDWDYRSIFIRVYIELFYYTLLLLLYYTLLLYYKMP